MIKKNKNVVKKIVMKRIKKSFNKENPSELINQLVKVISRDYPEESKIIHELKEISSKLYKAISKY